jgi:methionine-R-sulfoxide reductase
MKNKIILAASLILLSSASFAAEKVYTKSEAALKNLTPEQYKVTQEGETERPFRNAYWDNKREGIYVDVVTGEPLFSSTDKFDSGTGWPSFTKPINESSIATKSDNSMLVERTEIKSKSGDTHLGHVFNDGPKEKGGKRYCTNSASLLFVPKEDLITEGYAQYISLFEK